MGGGSAGKDGGKGNGRGKGIIVLGNIDVEGVSLRTVKRLESG